MLVMPLSYHAQVEICATSHYGLHPFTLTLAKIKGVCRSFEEDP